MITHKNQLEVMEVSCYSREAIEGGVIIRYLIRTPGETAWHPVKLFRPNDPGGTNVTDTDDSTSADAGFVANGLTNVTADQDAERRQA